MLIRAQLNQHCRVDFFNANFITRKWIFHFPEEKIALLIAMFANGQIGGQFSLKRKCETSVLLCSMNFALAVFSQIRLFADSEITIGMNK